MKLISSRICRKRYKVQTKVRRWIRGSRWSWNTGKSKPDDDKSRTSK